MLNVSSIRKQFPSLAQVQDGQPVIFFDNPGGTQAPQTVIDAMVDYLRCDNANHNGAFPTSQRSDAMLQEAHQAMADMLGAASAEEIVFGPNMTTLTFSLSRALGQWLKPEDEIIVTHLDHDANITPWVLMARDAGAKVRWSDFNPADCTLNLKDLEAQISKKTRLVACGYASNAVGTINDVKTIVQMARQVNALVYVDAVQYAPHGVIDVQALDCDFLTCSAYKFFGPHEGILYGKYNLLDQLPAYKVRPAGNQPPYKFETGTQNHEGIAGTLAAVEYIASLSGSATKSKGQSEKADRRRRILAGLKVIEEYEQVLIAKLVSGLQQIKGLRIYGITDPGQFTKRVPTVSFRLEGLTPREVAEYLGQQGIFVWDGNYYALAVTERLDVEKKGGMVRVGLVHYNTVEEVDRLLNSLQSLLGR